MPDRSLLLRPGATVGRLRLAGRLGATGETELWDAIDVDSGERVACWLEPSAPGPRLVREERLACTLADLLIGDEPAAADPVLTVAVAAAFAKAGTAEGDGARGSLADRTLLLPSGWTTWGEAADEDAAVLLACLDPADAIGLHAMYAGGAPHQRLPLLLRLLGSHLAGERHALVRRLRTGAQQRDVQRLLSLAARLARALPPPASDAGPVRSDARTIRLEGGELAWDGADLSPRLARAAARELSRGGRNAELRRWLLAMGHLRVDRELLRRRG